jgi:hypothetical protein
VSAERNWELLEQKFEILRQYLAQEGPEEYSDKKAVTSLLTTADPRELFAYRYWIHDQVLRDTRFREVLQLFLVLIVQLPDTGKRQ